MNMSYKIIKNAAGEVISFGPNDNNYEPNIPAGYVLSIVAELTPPSLSVVQAKQNTILTAAYNAAIQLPVAYMATTFQADKASQEVLALSLAAGKVMAGFYWIDANNAKVPMTFTEAEGLAYVMLVQGQAAFDKLFTKKTAIYAATTSAAVQAVVW